MTDICQECGMVVGKGPRYHPYLACLMMKIEKSGKSVEENLRAVVKYGMEAQRLGVSLDRAMDDISSTRMGA